MSSTSKPKNVSFENIRLVSKEDIHKRERMNTNINLKNIARNPDQIIEEEDDSDFFDFSEDTQ
jgi:hypothetical protein